MRYRGYEIRRAPYEVPGLSVSEASGIYADGKLMSYAHDHALARRAVDAHTASGLWPRLEGDDHDTQGDT